MKLKKCKLTGVNVYIENERNQTKDALLLVLFNRFLASVEAI
jgi:hypothetical protein